MLVFGARHTPFLWTSLVVLVTNAMNRERNGLPYVPGLVILQDQASVLAQILPVESVENMAHGFWSEQPGAGLCLQIL